MPRSKLGKWAAGFLAGFLVLFIALLLGMWVLHATPGTPLILVVGISAVASGLASLITGTVSLIKQKDHSPVVMLAIVFGLIALIIVAFELAEAISERA